MIGKLLTNILNKNFLWLTTKHFISLTYNKSLKTPFCSCFQNRIKLFKMCQSKEAPLNFQIASSKTIHLGAAKTPGAYSFLIFKLCNFPRNSKSFHLKKKNNPVYNCQQKRNNFYLHRCKDRPPRTKDTRWLGEILWHQEGHLRDPLVRVLVQ